MRTSVLQRISDGMLPSFLTKLLYHPFYKKDYIELNGWSFVHGMSGSFLACVFPRTSFKDAIMLHACWEFFQYIAGDNKLWPESKLYLSIVDIFFDTLFFMIGFYMFKK